MNSERVVCVKLCKKVSGNGLVFCCAVGDAEGVAVSGGACSAIEAKCRLAADNAGLISALADEYSGVPA